MVTETPKNVELALEPLPYQRAIRDFLKREESQVWQWYASHRVRDETAESVRFDLLKTTYRLGQQERPELYQAARRALEAIGLEAPVTIYQAQEPQGCNASLAFLPSEAHIVLHGPILERLREEECLAILGHELSHLLLWRGWDGDYLIVDQILTSLTNDPHAAVPHFATARLFQLYGEVFCDRGAMHVAQDPKTVVSAIVKTYTGMDRVDVENYWLQAEEIFQAGRGRTEGLTHPEAYIRARALQLWAEHGEQANAAVREMIEGQLQLDHLDLLGQQRIAQWTRRLIDQLLSPAWFQSDPVLAHARAFFEDYQPPESAVGESELAKELAAEIADGHASIADYCCFVILDFVSADRELEELPLARALEVAEGLGLKDRLVELARKELRLRKSQIDKIDGEKQSLLQQAAKRR